MDLHLGDADWTVQVAFDKVAYAQQASIAPDLDLIGNSRNMHLQQNHQPIDLSAFWRPLSRRPSTIATVTISTAMRVRRRLLFL
jgi:hypothetical protein